MTLTQYKIPNSINYVAAFLTLACKLGCSYCINRAGEFRRGSEMDWNDWAKGLARFNFRPDLPLTLQGGEPTQFPDFYRLISKLPRSTELDLLTNCQFDIDSFILGVEGFRFQRVAKYAPIRVSFHAEKMDAVDTVDRITKLIQAGFKVGVWAVDVPKHRSSNEHMQNLCMAVGIDFRWKEYLAEGFGKYKMPDSCYHYNVKKCMCRTSEILISPSGHFHRCHADLYAGRDAIGHILDATLPDFTEWRPCSVLGQCNPCDQKIKTNRHQEYGHTSVEVREAAKIG